VSNVVIADPNLPIASILDELYRTLNNHNRVVLEAPPGAGKTTTVPLALLNAPWRGSKKILMLEPRRVAARAAAERMARLLGETVGERVGYSIRLEQKRSANTVIEVVTEGILTRRLQQDPELADTAIVIFDEFHERNIHSDLGLALCLQGQELFRDQHNPLKLLVMSATLNGEAVSTLMGKAPIIRSEGRTYPVQIHYGSTAKTGADITPAIVETVEQALQKHSGNVLVFLPGQKEIRTCAQRLNASLDTNIAILPLHGGIPPAEQQKALAPLSEHSQHSRKVVLATDIAETSLTIEGVNTVVDSGLARKPQFDPRTGMTRLHTVRLSKASSIQRAGRAGRLAAGNCYRLWSEDQQAALLPHTPPEIIHSDLSALALQLLQWGISDPEELQWLDAPAAPAYRQAIDLLRQLGAVSVDNTIPRLTKHGERLAGLPLQPRLAHMLVIADTQGLLKTASQLAALLSERLPQNGPGADIEYSLQVLQGTIHCPAQQRAWLRRVQQQAQHYLRAFSRTASTAKLNNAQVPGFLLACAYPDRIAQKRENSRHCYLLSNGRSARLNERDPLAGCDYLAIADLGGTNGQSDDRIFSACSLDPALFDQALQHLLKQRELVEWQNDKLLAEEHCCVGKLILSRRPLQTLSSEQRIQAVLNLLSTEGLGLLSWSNDILQWRARVQLLREQFPSHSPPWPDLSDEHLQCTMDSWLAPFLENVKKRADLKQLKLHSILETLLTWPQPQRLNELAPTRISVPSGSQLSIDYRAYPPVLEVKLQEMFGCKDTPTVANGQVKLLVHLLSPARRPLQITQDLEGFWNSSYEDVKKEMKGRYPKHPWPDNPWEHQATRYTKSKHARNKP